MASPKTKVGLIGGTIAAATIGGAVFLASSSDINVAVGGDVQAAINGAGCSSTVVLEAGQAYAFNGTLPNKDCGEQWITIQSSRANELPEGVRVTPSQSHLLAKLQSTVNAEPVVKTAPGAHHYRFIGIQFETRDEGVFVYDLVRFGEGRQTQDLPEEVPHHIEVLRSMVPGRANQQTQRGISLNCRDCGVRDSYIAGIAGAGMDTQAICVWNTPGPFHIINNFLEATGEVVMLGGVDPANEAFIPSNGEIRRNHLFKRLSWKSPPYYTIKNLLEIKNGRNITIDGNVLENNWGGTRPDGGDWGQSGIAVLFTVRNQEGTAPWSIISNVSFTNNIVKNAPGALNFLGSDNEKPSAQASAARVANNVFDGITGTFITINGYLDVTVENNTHLQTCGEGCNTILFYGSALSHRFIYRNNVTQEKPYGIRDENGTAEGTAALAKWAPGYVFSGNVMATPYTKNPEGNEYLPALTITSDYRTPYTGKGADIDALNAAQAGVGPPSQPSPTSTVVPLPSLIPSPTPVPSPSPTPTLPAPSPTGTPTPVPQPSPTVSPTPLRFCRSGERPGTPPVCRCRNGMLGNSGKCR
jgi:hypothetical protein